MFHQIKSPINFDLFSETELQDLIWPKMHTKKHDSTKLTREISIAKEKSKLRRLGVRNQIVDSSDSKPSKFDLQFGSDSKSNDEIGDSKIKKSNFIEKVEFNQKSG